MRRLLAVLFLCIASGAALAADDADLRAFASRIGLADVGGLVATLRVVEKTGKLPQRYITKQQAEKLGWRPGDDLCRKLPGRAMGGDTFFNREGLLPVKPARRYVEADLDYNCGPRGPARLVFSNDGLRYVTTDHYQTFHEVPR